MRVHDYLIAQQDQVTVTVALGTAEGSSTAGSLNTVDQPFELYAIKTELCYVRNQATSLTVDLQVRTNFAFPLTDLVRTNYGFSAPSGLWSSVSQNYKEFWNFLPGITIPAGSSYTVTTTAQVFTTYAAAVDVLVSYVYFFLPVVTTLGIKSRKPGSRF